MKDDTIFLIGAVGIGAFFLYKSGILNTVSNIGDTLSSAGNVVTKGGNTAIDTAKTLISPVTNAANIITEMETDLNNLFKTEYDNLAGLFGPTTTETTISTTSPTGISGKPTTSLSQAPIKYSGGSSYSPSTVLSSGGFSSGGVTYSQVTTSGQNFLNQINNPLSVFGK